MTILTNIHNRYKFTFLLILLSFCTLPFYGQQVIEAARYSQNYYGGSARVMGTAGAYGAIGADFGGLSINPAGLGLYRQSELSISPSLQIANNKNTYLGGQTNESGMRFLLNNIGYVSNMNRPRKGRTTGLITSSYAIGINRLNSFIDQNYIDGTNAVGLSNYADRVFGQALGSGPVRQREIRSTIGGMNEGMFALGFNYSNKWYFAVQLGIPYFKYDSELNYVENDSESSIVNFEELNLEERLLTKGVGVNAKLGVIYRPDDLYRFGLAFHSPTVFEMEDEYTEYETLTQDTEDGFLSENLIDNFTSSFAYSLRTPSKWVASAALFPYRKGFISVDYEFVNYGKARFDNSFEDTNIDNQGFFSSLNQEVARDLRAASNVKIGIEYAPEMFRLRAGYAFIGSPIQTQSLRAPNHILSAGIGLRAKRVLLDLAYSTTIQNYEHVLYSGGEFVETKNQKNQILLTFGFKL